MKKNRLFIFCVVTALFWFSLYTYVPTLSPYAQSLGASYKMVGLIIGSYGLTQMLIRIPLGILSDLLRRRKVFIISGLILSLMSSLGMWYFKSPGWLLFFRALSGAAAATWVTFTVLFSSYYAREKSPVAIGTLNSFNYLGQMSAMLAAGVVARAFSVKHTFLLASIGGIAGIILSLFITENKDIDREPMKLSGVLEVVKKPSLIMISLFAVISQFLDFATVYGFTPVFAKSIGADSFQLSLLSTFSVLPGILASALSGSFFAKKIGEYNTIMSGFIIVSLSCFSIPIINNIGLLYISQFLGGFGRGLVFSLLMGLSIKGFSEKSRATAMGFFQAVYGLGMFLGPVVVGFLSDNVGLKWGFIAVGIIGAGGALLAKLYHTKRTA